MRLVLVLILTCAVMNGPLPASAAAQASDLFEQYLTVQQSLAADDFDAARTALTAMGKNGSGEVQTLAVRAAAAKDVKEMRKAFKPLSERMAREPLPAGLRVAFCPMFEKGSEWIQKDGDLANPYYGKQMLKCGEFKKSK